MKIGFDLRVLASGSQTGVQQYASGLLGALLKDDTQNEYKFFYNGRKKVELNNSWINKKKTKLYSFNQSNRLLDGSLAFFKKPCLDEKIEGVDVYFAPHFLRVATKKALKVLTFHDLSFCYHPEFFSTKHKIWHWSANPQKRAREADQIVAVSESTKNDLVNIYGIDDEKIEVIYSGIEDSFFDFKSSSDEILAVRKKYRLPPKFILFFGTIEPRKNLIGLIEAFEILKKDGKFKDVHLVLAGSFGWLYSDILKRARKSKFAEFIKFTGFVQNIDKKNLYSLAELFVYPSFFEGFGFPPLEAMACGVPVICSNKTSLPEVVGDAAVMIDPYVQSELAEVIKLLLSQPDFSKQLVQKGIARAGQFRWQNTAKQFLKMLNNLK